MFAASKEQFKVIRPEAPQEDFDMQNMGGDLLLDALHFIFWTFVLMLIEYGAFDCFKCLIPTKKIPPKDDLELDEDVLEEETRVAKTPKD